MNHRFGPETEFRRLWHRVTGTVVLLSSSGVAGFVIQWLSIR
jgi:hypothetical protein